MVKSKPVILLIDNSVAFTGAFRCALEQAQLMRSLYTYVFVLPEGAATLNIVRAQGFKVYTLPMLEIRKSGPVLLQYIPRLARNVFRLQAILKKEDAVVVVMNDFYNLLGAGVKLTGYKGKLVTYVRFLPAAMPGPLRKLWTASAQRYADAVVAVSNAVLRQLPPHVKNHRIYDAVKLPVTLPAKEFVTADAPVRFLYLGNFIRGKGQDYAIKAFKAVAAREPDVHLAFVGGDMGLQKNKTFKRELEQYAAINKLTSRVSFHPFTGEIEAEIKNADVVLNFSEAESFSMTCAEASFYGVPVIATRCGGPEEIIVHEETGLLVKNKDIEEMKTAMLRLVQSASLRKEYGRLAAARVKNTFSQEKFVQQFATLLKEMGVPDHEN